MPGLISISSGGARPSDCNASASILPAGGIKYGGNDEGVVADLDDDELVGAGDVVATESLASTVLFPAGLAALRLCDSLAE